MGKSGGVRVRRLGALERLNRQLEQKSYVNSSGEIIRLTEKGEKRIKKEIEILKQRI